jgi:hypothetical protein
MKTSCGGFLAGVHDLTLIHYDADFEIAAEFLPLRHQWVLRRGVSNHP